MIPLSKILAPGTILLSLAVAIGAQNPKPGKNSVTVRGQAQKIYFYPAEGTVRHRKIMFAPGDRGCEGFAVTISERLAESGYDTYCIDTRRYLESFTGRTVLDPSEIASDFKQVARWIEPDNRLVIMGWSEGAGLGLAAASDRANQTIFEGLVAIGTPEDNILAWHWKDLGASLTKTLPHEPTFKSADFMAKVSPLPVFMIASTSNEYVSPEATSKLFTAAREPKRLVMVKARDHKYSDNPDDFFRVLQEGLTWIDQHHR